MLLMAAMEATGISDPLSWLLNYGVAGAVIALLVLGRLRTKSETDGLTAQLATAQADLRDERAANAALVTQITNNTLPQMASLEAVLDSRSRHEDRLLTKVEAIIRRLEALEHGGR